MKNSQLTGLLAAFLMVLILPACKKSTVNQTTTTTTTTYTQVNLVSNLKTVGAATVDSNAVNSWGIAFGSSGALWVSNNGTGTSTVYDRNGKILINPVPIPSPGMPAGGQPTGIVFNGTSDFTIPSTQKIARFIFVNEDGVISAWAPGAVSAVTVGDNSASHAVYKGLTIAAVGGANFIYVTNFYAGTIEVYDGSFKAVPGRKLVDASIPAGFAPFDIQNIGGLLYVAYAKQSMPAKHDDMPGLGNGYVNIFNPDGTFVKRFASQGTLNSPWGMTQAPAGFGQGAGAILVGNFGDGKISVYDATGKFKGQLMSKGAVLSIDGLWGLAFPQNNIPAGDQNALFFAAGPNGTANGLVGYLTGTTSMSTTTGSYNGY